MEHFTVSYNVITGETEIIPFPPEEVARMEAAAVEFSWKRLREERNRLLSGSDWTQVGDAPVDKSAWAAYREELRNLPQNTIDPLNPVWPVPPT